MKTLKNKSQFVLSSILIFFVSSAAIAQSINLIGVKLENDSVHIIEWNSETPTISTSVGTSIFTFLAGSAAYNATNSTYYVRGLVDSGSAVVKYTATTNTQEEVDLTSFYNGSIESDMSNGMMYYYQGNSANEVYVYKYDPYLDTSIALGMLPWSSGFSSGSYIYFPDATCFNSNTHTYYFTIASDVSTKYLVSIPVSDSVFSYTITPFTGIAMPGNIGLEFDNVNNRIYSLFPTYDTFGMPPTMNVGLLDPITANASLLLAMPNLEGYEVFNRCFDQASNSLVFVAYDSLYERSLYTYNIDSNLLNVFPLPSPTTTYEIEVNNTAFARLKYNLNTGISAISAGQGNFMLYPNPAVDAATLDYSLAENTGFLQIQIMDALGKEIANSTLETASKDGSYTLDLSPLQSGMFFVKMSNGNRVQVKKLQVFK